VRTTTNAMQLIASMASHPNGPYGEWLFELDRLGVRLGRGDDRPLPERSPKSLV
jgi:hypothetical protein